MRTFTPNDLPYPVTPPAIDAAGLTTSYGEAVRGSGFGVAREHDDVLRYTGPVEALRASVRAERHGGLAAARVRPAGVWL